MRLLIICHSYTPALTPRAFRWSALAEHWAAAGEHVDVVSGGPAHGSAYELMRGVHVHRPGQLLGGLASSAAAVRSHTVIQEGSEPSPMAPQALARIRTGVLGVARTIWRSAYWPDYACLWYRPASSCAQRLLASGSYDGVITVSLPYTGHLVGMALHRRGLLTPRSKWIVDIGDPFAFMDSTPTNNHFLYRRLNYRSESSLVSSASSIAVTTSATRERYAATFAGIADKLHVIPPLASLGQSPGSGATIRGSSLFDLPGKIRLAYFGTLYRNIREPRFLLRLFTALLETKLRDKLELHFFGNNNDCEELLAGYRSTSNGKLFLHGTVDRATVAAALDRADIVVNIGNRTPYQLPSKVVEQASLGKPILNLVSSTDDSSRSLLATYPAALSIVERTVIDPEDLSRLVSFIEHPPRVEESVLLRWCEPFRIGPIAAAYEELLAS